MRCTTIASAARDVANGLYKQDLVSVDLAAVANSASGARSMGASADDDFIDFREWLIAIRRCSTSGARTASASRRA